MVDAQAMQARIERGTRLESADEMTADYRDNLVHLMTMQADSELAGGYGYVPWIHKAPTVEEKHVVAQIVKDELRHAAVMYALLEDLGVDVEAHVRRHDEALGMRIDAAADIGTRRITDDKRVNIFYYPIDTWADFIFFNFCMDRGAGHQLEDVRQCSYGPWVRAIEGIFKEEKFHIRHGEHWVKRLAGDTATHDEAQTTFARWYVRTMNIFGRPGSKRNAQYRAYRLKLRDNDEVRSAFAAEVKELCAQVGLTVPEWKPVWADLPEEAHIPASGAVLRRAGFFLAALLTAAPALADEGRLGPFDLTVGSRVWVSSANVNWNFAGNLGAGPVDVLSELRWRGADALVTEINADLVWRRLVLSVTFGRGDVDGGVLIDDDFAQSRRRARFSHTRSSVEGDLFYVSADVGARIVTWGAAGQGHVDVLAGYQHWHEQYEAFGLTGIFDLTPFGIPVVLPNAAPPSLKVITHDYTIHSVRVGARTRIPLVAGLALHARLFLVPWSSFELEDRHHLRSDLRQNPSFSSEAEGGFGVQVGGGVSYTWQKLRVDAGWEFWHLDSGRGDKFTFVPGVPKIRDRLNEITIERSGPYLGVSYRF